MSWFNNVMESEPVKKVMESEPVKKVLGSVAGGSVTAPSPTPMVSNEAERPANAGGDGIAEAVIDAQTKHDGGGAKEGDVTGNNVAGGADKGVGATAAGAYGERDDDGIADAVGEAQTKQNNNGSTDDTIPTFEEDDEVIKYLEEQRDANRRLTPDEVKKLRRRQRTEAIVSGISDAVRSLSNLFFTSQYAPNMYDHTKGMSESTKARWDKTWKEREAENDRSLNYALKAHSLRAQRAATQYQHARDKMLDELKEREQTRKEEWDAWRIEKDKLDNDIKSKQLEIARATGEAKVKAQNELAEMYKARAELYKRTPMMGGSRGGSGGGGSRTTPYSLTVYGETEYYNKPQERETAIYGYARELGIPTTTTTGTWPKKKEVKRNINDVAADIERQTRGKTRPGRTSGGSNSGKEHADL